MFELRDYQKEASDKAIEFFNDDCKDNGIIVLPTGCHAKGSLILMYDGTTKAVEDIEVGDVLMGDDGTPRNVIRLHRGDDEMYRVTPIKGEPFVVNGGHILHLWKSGDGKEGSQYEEISVSEYVQKSQRYKDKRKLHRASSLPFGTDGVPEPYMLGILVGDGSLRSQISITTQRQEVVNEIYAFAERYGMKVRATWKEGSKAKSYLFSNKVYTHEKNPLVDWLIKYELWDRVSNNKFIPHDYLTACFADRMQLMAGLLDTDSYLDKKSNCFEYCTKSRKLAYDVQFLARSLGFFAMIGKPRVIDGQRYYRIHITGDLSRIPNRVAIRKGNEFKAKRNHYVCAFDAEAIGRGEYYGFEVDGNHLYCDWQLFVHHNSGKSIVIADIASRLDGNLLVFQPSKEILEQNYAKLLSYGYDAGIFSASVGRKDIKRITFATIGSVKNCKERFDEFRYILVDECHLVGAKGMYADFFNKVDRKILGLTATPFRLKSFRIKHTKDENGRKLRWPRYENRSMLEFLTLASPKVFKRMLYHVQVKTLLERGYLANLRYFDLNVIDSGVLKRNTSGSDYSEESIKQAYKEFDFMTCLVNIVERLQHPKSGIKRKGIMVFTKFVEEAEALRNAIPSCEVVSGDTPKKERERILEEFKSGKIEVVANVNCLSTGFDFPALDTVVLARPTMSLSFYYQAVGRAIRPHDGKEGWIVDLCGSLSKFGKVEDLFIYKPEDGKEMMCGKLDGRNKKLTNIPLK